MRRDEFKVEDKEYFNELLKSSEYGILSLIDDNKTYSVPVNFANEESCIYMHGALSGRKYSAIQKNSSASFLVTKPFSFIPSTFFNTNLACPATQFFASLMCEGEVKTIDEIEQKAKALNILMNKFQDKDSFIDIEKNIKTYKNMINKTAIFNFEINSWSLKVKIGQNIAKEKLENIIDKLEESGSDIDRLTIKQIKKFANN